MKNSFILAIGKESLRREPCDKHNLFFQKAFVTKFVEFKFFEKLTIISENSQLLRPP